MSLTNFYLVTTKNLPAFLNAVQGAKAPERFNNKFLTQLDFTSSNDRLFLGLFKALGFVDESGVPTKRYYAFLDQSEASKVLTEAVREAYEDLFAVNRKANELSVEDVTSEAKKLYTQWPSLPLENKRSIIESIVEKVTIGKDEIDLTLSYIPSSEEMVKSQQELLHLLGISHHTAQRSQSTKGQGITTCM